MFDFTPWFVGGGAQHSPEVARLLAYVATSGAEGVIDGGDLKVTALDVPGTSVRVAPGAIAIRNRASGGDRQTYAARNVSSEPTAIASTGSGSGRSDLVAVIIEDPFVTGGQGTPPADPTTAQYVFVRTIPNVPAGTTKLQKVAGYENATGYALARVDLPAATGTVTNAMIVDVRGLLTSRQRRIIAPVPASGGNAPSSPDEQKWPNETMNVDVPEWGARLVGTVTLTGITQQSGAIDTQHRVRVGSSLFGDFAYFTDSVTAGTRQTITIPVDVVIPTALRGTRVNLLVLTKRRTASSTSFSATAGSATIIYDVQVEAALS